MFAEEFLKVFEQTSSVLPLQIKALHSLSPNNHFSASSLFVKIDDVILISTILVREKRKVDAYSAMKRHPSLTNTSILAKTHLLQIFRLHVERARMCD